MPFAASRNGPTKYRTANGTSNGKESPWDRTSLFGKYSLSFMWPLFRQGYSKQLTLGDIGAPPRVDASRTLGLKLQQSYNQELLTAKKPSFTRAMAKTFGPMVLLISLMELLSKCVFFPMQAVVLGWIIRDAGLYFASTSQPPVTADIAPPAVVAQAPTLVNATTALPTTAFQTQLDLISNQPDNFTYRYIVYDAILLIVFTTLSVITSHPFFTQTYHLGMKCRIAACYMIYKKSLRLNQAAMHQTTVGQMVNLLSNDVNRFDQVCQMIPHIYVAPLQALTVMAILSVFYLGVYPTLASLLAIVLYVGIQTAMGRGFSRFRSKTAKRTDERVRLMNEIILAMRIIKMYAWEEPFKRLVYAARKREMTTIAIASILKAINQTLFFISSKVIVFVALMTYILLGSSLTPEVVFVSIGLANLVRISLTLFFPNAIAYTAETIISCRRINNFLMLPEIQSTSITYKASNDGYGCKYAVGMNKVYCAWDASNVSLAEGSDARWAIVRNLSLSIKPRDLVLVVGRVGSGKSSVLMALLGELPVTSGRIEMNGRVSYASQDAWIFSGTVRDNILFGKPMRKARYQEVIRVCSLERDLQILVEGDSTVVGERGVSLSGGQKARVNLARALYMDADIYLLDDPLSAVDAPVAKHIFNESLRTFLKKKTVVLATHQLQFLRYATKVLVVDRNCPAAFGTLQEVMESEAFAVVDYSKEAFEDATTGTDGETTTDLAGSGGIGSPRVVATTERQETTKSQRPRSGTRSPVASGSGSGSDQQKASSVADEDSGEFNENDRLIRQSSQASSNLTSSMGVIDSLVPGGEKGKRPLDYAEDDSDGARKTKDAALKGISSNRRRVGAGEKLSEVSTNFATYLYYLKNATGLIMFIWFLLTNLLAQGIYQFTDFFLSYWSDSVQRKEVEGAAFVPINTIDNLNTSQISGAYAILVGLCFAATFCRAATFFVGTLRASINIHHKLFNSIIRAPMTFFDFSPIGILLNRLSRDVGFVDETLPATAIEIITIFVNVSGVLILTIIIDYKNAAASVVLLIVAFLIRNFCARTITRLKQIEGVTRSPIFSHLSTTLSGLPTIRAFRVQDDFVRRFDTHQDQHSSAWFNYICAGRCVTITMDWLCLMFVACVVTLLLTVSLDGTNASLVGLLISQAVVLPGPFQWGIRQLIEVESQMTSVQRIKEFSELKSESDVIIDDTKSPDDAAIGYQSALDPEAEFKPAQGEVSFANLTLSYFSDEPPVLKNLNFTIRAREKVGIVGRTGAGKSSIVAVLFRLYKFEGSVQIDGRDTKLLSLRQLRRCMSIIPQDPILFGGTIRKNLDPFGEYADEQLWAALDAVQLKPLFARSDRGLEYAINEGGANFSVGQRQLICLARAIVRRNQILVLDEATANVDPETDVFIQRTIGQQFAQCTVITIAHRLVTIVGSDRVLVLDRGEVREFGDPHELLQRDGLFAQMVDSSAQQATRLRKTIELEHLKRVGTLTSGAEMPELEGSPSSGD